MDQVQVVIPASRDFAAPHLLKQMMPPRPINSRQPQHCSTPRRLRQPQQRLLRLHQHPRPFPFAIHRCRLIHPYASILRIHRRAARVNRRLRTSSGRQPLRHRLHPVQITPPITLNSRSASTHAIHDKIRPARDLPVPCVGREIRHDHLDPVCGKRPGLPR